MNQTNVLVIGATGMLGVPVVKRLSADGLSVKVAGRSAARLAQTFPGLPSVAMDVEDLASVARALEGCSAVHLNLSGGGDPWHEARGAQNVARAAKTMGLSRITLISGASVCAENAWFDGTRAKLAAEEAVRSCGVPHTIFKPTWFMESLPRFVQGRRATVIGRQPLPIHWVAAEDYARMVSKAFVTPLAANKSLYVFGPEPATMEEALSRYCAVASPGTRVVHAPHSLMWLVATLGRKKELRASLPFFWYCESVGETADPTEANRILGAPTLTLEEWARRRTGVAPGVPEKPMSISTST